MISSSVTRGFSHLVPAIIISILLFVVSGCAPIMDFKTIKSPTTDIKPNKIFVIENMGDELRNETETFKSVLMQEIRKCGINVDYSFVPAVQHRLSLTDDQPDKTTTLEKIRNFNPDYILEIDETSYKTTPPTQTSIMEDGNRLPGLQEINYLIKFGDYKSHSIIWSGNEKLFPANRVDNGEYLAKHIISVMAKDHVILTCSIR